MLLKEPKHLFFSGPTPQKCIFFNTSLGMAVNVNFNVARFSLHGSLTNHCMIGLIVRKYQVFPRLLD